MIRPGSRVAPLSSAEIEQKAIQRRTTLELDDCEAFPILHVLEREVMEGFEVVPAAELEGDEGRMYPVSGAIVISEETYLAAERGDGRARFTIAHELGHYWMHRKSAYSFRNSNAVILPFENSEWQADEFAGHLLAPIHIIRGLTAAQIAKRCQISMKAAIVRMNKVKHR